MKKLLKYRELILIGGLLSTVNLLNLIGLEKENEVTYQSDQVENVGNYTTTENKIIDNETVYDFSLYDTDEYFVSLPAMAIEVKEGFMFINHNEAIYITNHELVEKEFNVHDGESYQLRYGRYTEELYNIYEIDFTWFDGLPTWEIKPMSFL